MSNLSLAVGITLFYTIVSAIIGIVLAVLLRGELVVFVMIYFSFLCGGAGVATAFYHIMISED